MSQFVISLPQEMSSSFAYGGQELDLFAQARNWKRYVRQMLAPYVRGSVLEVGAGIGTTTKLLCDRSQSSWTCIEPDAGMIERLEKVGRELRGPGSMKFDTIPGTIADVPVDRSFDTILYVDVLEHIEDDHGEFAAAARHLNPGGAIVILAPAHPWLFSAFDKSIGHFRRYTKGMLRHIAPAALVRERLCYLDSAGVLASLGNRLMLGREMPSQAQVRAWDRILVPLSRVIDPLTFRCFGKSILGVWRRP